MRVQGVVARGATQADLDSIRSIAGTYGNLAAWPRRPDYLDHELSHGTLAVCEVDGEILGFGAVLERNGMAHLADLFVRPDRLQRGTGKALLTQLFASNAERLTFASKDPRALPLYIRFGMLPLAPLLYLVGDSTTAQRLPDPGLTLVEAGVEKVVELDQMVSGRRRPVDLDFLLSRAAAHAFLAMNGGEVIGYGFCRLAPTGDDETVHAFLGPAGAMTAPDAPRVAVALLRWAGEHAAQATIPVFGPNAATALLLNARFRIDDADTFMASRPGLIDLERYYPSTVLG